MELQDLERWLTPLFTLLAFLGKAFILAFVAAIATRMANKTGKKASEDNKDPP